jgi:hypothetical protein
VSAYYILFFFDMTANVPRIGAVVLGSKLQIKKAETIEPMRCCASVARFGDPARERQSGHYRDERAEISRSGRWCGGASLSRVTGSFKPSDCVKSPICDVGTAGQADIKSFHMAANRLLKTST